MPKSRKNNVPFEEWVPLKGFSKYEVSTEGNIRRRVNGRSTHKGRMIGGSRDRKGYLRVCIMSDDDRGVTARLSRLICITFHGEPPSEKHHAAHKNGNNRDNRPLNLYWATPVQNEKDKAMHGRTANGERCGRSKLKNKQVLVIREMIKAGIKRKDIAANYGVSVSTIALIAQNKKWREIV